MSADLPSLARLSYARELQGDLPGALDAMRRAAAAPGLAPENTAFALSLVGHLQQLNGDPVLAREAYEAAIELVPDHAPSIAGLGRLAVAARRPDGGTRPLRASRCHPAAPRVRHRSRRDARGRRRSTPARSASTTSPAPRSRCSRRPASRSTSSSPCSRPITATRRGPWSWPGRLRGRADGPCRRRPRLGPPPRRPRRGGLGRATEALRLGSKEPLFHYHAGAIAATLGERDAARRHLEQALRTDAGFSATGAAEARRLLDELAP